MSKISSLKLSDDYFSGSGEVSAYLDCQDRKPMLSVTVWPVPHCDLSYTADLEWADILKGSVEDDLVGSGKDACVSSEVDRRRILARLKKFRQALDAAEKRVTKLPLWKR